MKTKKLMLAASVCGLLITGSTFAQGLYLGFGGGYGFPAARQSLGSDVKTNTSGGSSTTEITGRSLSLGKGINVGGYIGYMFNKNIGAELGISYLMGGKTVFTDESSATNSTSKTEVTMRANMLRLVPTIRMMAGEGNLRPYMKTGLIIGIGTKGFVDEKVNSSNASSASVSEENWEYTGGLSLGFHGGLGLMYMISDGLGIFGEIQGNFQSWAAKKGVMTKNTLDGADRLSSLETYAKEVEYVDSYTIASGTPTNNGVPRQDTRERSPFSSVGINIGVHFTIGGGSSTSTPK